MEQQRTLLLEWSNIDAVLLTINSIFLYSWLYFLHVSSLWWLS